jgi:hypothetical protein
VRASRGTATAHQQRGNVGRQYRRAGTPRRDWCRGQSIAKVRGWSWRDLSKANSHIRLGPGDTDSMQANPKRTRLETGHPTYRGRRGQSVGCRDAPSHVNPWGTVQTARLTGDPADSIPPYSSRCCPMSTKSATLRAATPARQLRQIAAICSSAMLIGHPARSRYFLLPLAVHDHPQCRVDAAHLVEAEASDAFA